MKVTIKLALFISLLQMSCNGDDQLIGELEGTYIGTFQRAGTFSYDQISDVTLVFKDGRYEGKSSISKYPAVCRGSFSIINENIEFVNECPWTADFDWSFILEGKFNLYPDGNKVVIQRSYKEGGYDLYQLTKQ